MRVAVITPFLDRGHGTERCVIEQLEKLRIGAEIEVHIYAQRVQDLRGVVPYQSTQPQPEARLFWHRVPGIPGPHLLQYIFWFFANSFCRWWDGKFRGLKYDLTFSPGINARGADAIAVHMVFHEFYRQVISELSLRRTPMKSWPRLIHRRLYYRLIMALEKREYTRMDVSLAAVSGLVAHQLTEYFQRRDVRIIRNGVDAECFSAHRRLARRPSARQALGLRPADIALLLIGNDWKKKGLDGLLQALGMIRALPWRLLVVGHDARGPYEKIIRDREILDRVTFLPPSLDVLQFYAAADVYVGPSLEDAFGLPVLEAMACGLPVVASSRAGVSEIIRDGINGMVLRDPQDTNEIAAALRTLIADPALCERLGESARCTAQEHDWNRNAQEFWEWLTEVQTYTMHSPSLRP